MTGFLNIIKPTGMSSSDVVLKVKKVLQIKKVGHLGTLDPAASGVLPIAIGRCTKFFDYFLKKDKEYFAIVKFGIETDTLDSFGKITKNIEKRITSDQILKVLPKFLGTQNQIPPKYSAVKINGKSAYELARSGQNFEIKPKQIEIFSIDLIENKGDNYFLFRVHASAGTYIRTLFSDIAKSMETVSFTPVIIRTKSGIFDMDSAITLSELENGAKVLDIDHVFSKTPIVEANSVVAKKLIDGKHVSVNELNCELNQKNEIFVTYEGKFIGFYRENCDFLEKIVYLWENYL